MIYKKEKYYFKYLRRVFKKAPWKLLDPRRNFEKLHKVHLKNDYGECGSVLYVETYDEFISFKIEPKRGKILIFCGEMSVDGNAIRF